MAKPRRAFAKNISIHLCRVHSIPAGHGPFKQDVLKLWPRPDIVHHHQRPRRRSTITDDADMRQPPTASAAQIPRNDIAGAIVTGVVTRRKAIAFAGQKSFKVWHPAVIDIGVGTRQAPMARIRVEGRLHVFMNQHLKINFQCT